MGCGPADRSEAAAHLGTPHRHHLPTRRTPATAAGQRAGPIDEAGGRRSGGPAGCAARSGGLSAGGEKPLGTGSANTAAGCLLCATAGGGGGLCSGGVGFVGGARKSSFLRAMYCSLGHRCAASEMSLPHRQPAHVQLVLACTRSISLALQSPVLTPEHVNSRFWGLGKLHFSQRRYLDAH